MAHGGAGPGGRLALGLLGVGARGQRPVLLLPLERLDGVRQLLLPRDCHLGEQALDGVGGVRMEGLGEREDTDNASTHTRRTPLDSNVGYELFRSP